MNGWEFLDKNFGDCFLIICVVCFTIFKTLGLRQKKSTTRIISDNEPLCEVCGKHPAEHDGVCVVCSH